MYIMSVGTSVARVQQCRLGTRVRRTPSAHVKGIQLKRSRGLAFLGTIIMVLGLGPAAVIPASGASSCSISVDGATGYYVCGTPTPQLTWSKGVPGNRDYYKRVFVRGTNNAIYNIFTQRHNDKLVYNSGWKSLGGVVTAGPWAYKDNIASLDPWQMHVEVAGSNGAKYCNVLYYSRSGWRQC